MEGLDYTDSGFETLNIRFLPSDKRRGIKYNLMCGAHSIMKETKKSVTYSFALGESTDSYNECKEPYPSSYLSNKGIIFT